MAFARSPVVGANSPVRISTDVSPTNPPSAVARIGVIGVGAVGARVARQFVSVDGDAVVLRDPDRQRLGTVVTGLGEHASADHGALDAPLDVDVVVLAGPGRTQAELAARFVRAGRHVITTTDDLTDVRALLALDGAARANGVNVVVGAGFAPGLSCILAALAASRFDEVTEIHVAKSGTGGPACARQHHRALGRGAIDWRDGEWEPRPGGSGRELCWFPDPVGPKDCYRAELADVALLVPAFPSVERVTSRVSATRRDRLTARLPMLWPTDPEGGPGAVRVEVRGRMAGRGSTVVLGAMDRPAVAAGAVAAVAAHRVLAGDAVRPGAAGLAELFAPRPFLADLSARGVRVAVFEGPGQH